MYGLIHRAARQMAVNAIGETGWTRVLERSGAVEGDFLSGRLYPDQLTFAIVDALVAELGRPADALLRDLGRYWIEFIEGSSYSPMLDMTGGDLFSCLSNLDRMHATIKVSLPDARLPVFGVSRAGPDRLTVIYRSERAGLKPMVEGLLEGLMRRFGEDGEVACVSVPGGAWFELRLHRQLAA